MTLEQALEIAANPQKYTQVQQQEARTVLFKENLKLEQK